MKSTKNKYRIIAIDNNTITAVCGVIGIKTENIKLTSEYNYGISQPDNNTIILNKIDEVTKEIRNGLENPWKIWHPEEFCEKNVIIFGQLEKK